jgi:2'-5' RNA ligase
MVRSFVSVNLGPPAQEALTAALQLLRPRVPDGVVRWSTPSQWHLTLRFLGDLSPLQVDRLVDNLHKALARQAAFEVALEGLGCFPSLRAPRVLWVGLRPGDGMDVLRQLQGRVEAAVAELGHAPPDHPFSPHVTLGRVGQDVRVGPARKLGALLEGFHPPPLGTLVVDAVHVMQSRLGSHGVEHASLHHFALR